jgi:DNA polymerase
MTKQEQNKILHNLYLQKSFGYRYIEPFNLKKVEKKDTFMSKDTLQYCTLCDASKISKIKIYASGDSNSQIMFLTTVPSFDEASKEMFYKMVENVIGLPIDSIYLTSIIKCDISEKTPQLSSYISKCKDYIENQILNSNAKIIVTLGDSYNYLLINNSDISSVRGTVVRLNDKSIIPIYHPSFLLRNPSLKKETFEDLKKIKLLMEQL